VGPRRSPVSRHVLIDTSAYFALADHDDANYGAAQAILNNLATQRGSLFTTTFVAAETHALLLARLSQSSATRFLRELEQSSTTLVHPTVQDLAAARGIIYQYSDRDFSLTDAISFAVMERLGITIAFTFDRHFVQYGFSNLTPDPL